MAVQTTTTTKKVVAAAPVSQPAQMELSYFLNLILSYNLWFSPHLILTNVRSSDSYSSNFISNFYFRNSCGACGTTNLVQSNMTQFQCGQCQAVNEMPKQQVVVAAQPTTVVSETTTVTQTKDNSGKKAAGAACAGLAAGMVVGSMMRPCPPPPIYRRPPPRGCFVVVGGKGKGKGKGGKW